MSWVMVHSIMRVEKINLNKKGDNDAFGADGHIGSGCSEVDNDMACVSKMEAEIELEQKPMEEDVNRDMQAGVSQIKTKIELEPALEREQDQSVGVIPDGKFVKRLKVIKYDILNNQSISNCAFVSNADFPVDLKYIEVSHSGTNQNFIFAVKCCPQVDRGTVSFNWPQRRWACLSFGQEIEVKPYYFDLTSPFEFLSNITLEADFLRTNIVSIGIKKLLDLIHKTRQVEPIYRVIKFLSKMEQNSTQV